MSDEGEASAAGDGASADRTAADRRAASESTAEAGGRPCPICEEPMYHRHCKYVCPNHGVIMDCADTFY